MVLFFFNDTATTEIYTLSLHDALPIFLGRRREQMPGACTSQRLCTQGAAHTGPLASTTLLVDRKSTRLNSSHANISYAVFCLKKKNSSHLTITHLYVTPDNFLSDL